MHALIVCHANGKSGVPSTFTDVSKMPDCPLASHLITLKQIGASRLFKKVKKWFCQGRKGTLSYRFTGKETRMMCQNLIQPHELKNHNVRGVAIPLLLIFNRFLFNIHSTRDEIFIARPLFLHVKRFALFSFTLSLQMRSADDADVLHFSAIFGKLNPPSRLKNITNALFSGDILLVKTIVSLLCIENCQLHDHL